MTDTPASARPESSGQPLVSIIVPTFNRASFLERCLRSILDQSYRNIECLVMDAGSKDGSVEILQRFADADPRLKFISEPDKGEVYAVNRALDMIRGPIYGIQASDDFYTPGAIGAAVEFLQAHPEFAGVGGDALFVDGEGREMKRGMITYRGPMSREYVRKILIMRYEMSLLPHGSFFGWKDRVFKHGKFDPAFSRICDIEFYSRLLRSGEKIGCVPRVQLYYALHEDMGAVKHRKAVVEQLAKVYANNGMRWHHHALRVTVGRVASYVGNPYRAAFLPGLVWEFQRFWRTRFGSG